MYLEILYGMGLVALIFGSITDIKTREVPDWVSYGLMFAAVAGRILMALVYADWTILWEGALGFAIFVGLAYLMFYAGQWGGGDSKLLMGLGAIFGLTFSLDTPLLGFWINMLIVGSVYGLLFSAYLAIKNRKVFKQDWNKRIKRFRKIRTIVLVVTVILLLIAFFSKDYILTMFMITVAILSLTGFYLFIFIKSIEKTCMQKYVLPTELTEGDWIVKNVMVDGKRITGPKDLGIEKKQITTLIKAHKESKIDKILIKEGIPFIPSFLIAFVIQWIWGNLILIFI